MRRMYTFISNRWSDLQEMFQRVDASYTVQKYGESARAVERRAVIEKFRTDSLEAVQGFKGRFPQLAAENKAQRAAAAVNIARGLPPMFGQASAGKVSRHVDADARPLQRTLNAIAGQLRSQTVMQLAALEPTETLTARLSAYADQAKAGSEFPYRAYAIDRSVLSTILRSRAAAGDVRAQVALEADLCGRIEAALVDRAFPARYTPSDLEELSKTEALLRAINGEAGVKEAGDWIGFVGRTLLARDEPAPNPPAPAAEWDVVSNPVSAFGSPAAAPASSAE